MLILQSLVLADRGSNPRSKALKAGMLTITTPRALMRLGKYTWDKDMS